MTKNIRIMVFFTLKTISMTKFYPKISIHSCSPPHNSRKRTKP